MTIEEFAEKEGFMFNIITHKPLEFTPLVVKLTDGNITRAYYVEWSNTMYVRESTTHQVIEWRYYTEQDANI